jgi:hypothetical protein
MSQLFWLQGYCQVRLITTWNQDRQSTGHLLISLERKHEINFGDDIVKNVTGKWRFD